MATVVKGGKGTVQMKVGDGSDRAEVILKESRRGYDLIVMGASKGQGLRDALSNILVDRVVQEAPCATMIVKSHVPFPQGEFCPLPVQPIRHILVPTVGSKASLNAVEMARSQAEYILFDQQTIEPVLEIARKIVEYQAQVSRRLGAVVIVLILF